MTNWKKKMTKKIDSCQPEITCQTRDLINSIGKKTIRFDSQQSKCRKMK